MRIALACLLALTASPAVAQSWTFAGEDDGVWFQAWAATPVAGTLDLFCGGPSPQGKPLTGEHYESGRTDPGEIQLAIGFKALGFRPSNDLDGPPRKVGIAVDGMTYRTKFQPNQMHDLYFVDLSVKDPLLAALAEGKQATVTVGGRATYKVALAGAGKAISQAVAFCAKKQG